MPPTTGHLQLAEFAAEIPDVTFVTVVVCTQPHEPLSKERFRAVDRALYDRSLFGVEWYNKTIEQNPEAPGFWDTWEIILRHYGVGENTIIVASEPYGQKLAEIRGAKFMPYDIDRQINGAKATQIRKDPTQFFEYIIPEFQRYLQTTVTIFGAESTGKTTLARTLSEEMNAPWIFEWARPYLDHTVNEITPASMRTIWRGQAALQQQARRLNHRPLLIQDTDLYSTIGYWELPHWQETLGQQPAHLHHDAERLKSDLYIITPSNIPFEEDPLRYGGDKREASDAYWIGICERYNLPYFVLTQSHPFYRACEAERLITHRVNSKLSQIAYDRHGL